MFRVELERAIRRWRTWLLAVALAGVPILIVAAVKFSPPPPSQNARDAPPFLLQIVRNGLFAPLTGLAVVQPFFLSLAIGLFAGDAIAGEAQTGTLRYLLVRPVRRIPLLAAKFASAMTLTAAVLLGVVLAGVLAGAVVFGLGPLPTLSGTTLPVGQALGRIVGSGFYILLAASGITAIGIFISTLTDSGPGAIVATVIVAIASQVVDNIPSLHALYPYIPTHGWLGYTGLFRFPVDWSLMRAGLTVSLAYTIAFIALAAWTFRHRDVTS
jgi:ABC-2 type transport system permease protein